MRHISFPILHYPFLQCSSNARSIRDTPCHVMCNRSLISTSIVFALGALPLSELTKYPYSPLNSEIDLCMSAWDQGSASVITLLPGFQQHFGIDSGTIASNIQKFVSIFYIGYAVGAALSFFINDRIDRLWSYRLYNIIWIIGQITASLVPGLTVPLCLSYRLRHWPRVVKCHWSDDLGGNCAAGNSRSYHILVCCCYDTFICCGHFLCSG